MTTAQEWSSRLDAAMVDGGILTHYQPIVDLARATVVGYEGLARFPAHPTTSPASWFTAARAHGRLAALEAVSLRSALAGRERLPPNTFLSVNVGPDVLDDPAVLDVLEGQGSLAGVVVELTEHARVDSYRDLRPQLERLRSAGGLIAIDDAGAGYAGLQHLIDIRPDMIKLDRNLVGSVDRDEARRALIEMVGTFASRVDAWVLAEGVETIEELETLTTLGVPLAQGYYLARPGEPWPELVAAATVQLRSLVSRQQQPTVRRLVERARTAFTLAHARTLYGPDHSEVVVIIDDHGRPVSVRDRDGLLRPIHDRLRVNVDTPVPQAAHRALTRPEASRFTPLLCIDNAGRLLGVVRMERILDHLASAAALQPAAGD